MLTVKELLGGRREIILGSLWDLGINIGNGSASTTALPLLLAKIIMLMIKVVPFVVRVAIQFR